MILFAKPYYMLGMCDIYYVLTSFLQFAQQCDVFIFDFVVIVRSTKGNFIIYKLMEAHLFLVMSFGHLKVY